MNHAQHIALDGRRATYLIENTGKFQPIWLNVTVSVDDYDQIEVIGIELYATREAAKAQDLSRFLGEDCWDALDESARKAIYAEIHRQDAERRSAEREEALRSCPPSIRAELDRDLANALRLAPVFDSIFGRIGR